MKHYVLIYDYTADFMTRRAPYRDAHLELARASVARQELQLGGALVGESMAILLFKAESPAVVEQFAQADPYVAHGVVTSYRIREWTTVVGADACAPLPRP